MTGDDEETGVGADVLADLNWLAVIVGAVAYFALGAVWYAEAVFGRTWARAMGWEGEDEAAGAGLYVVPLVTCLVATVAVAMLAAATGADTLGDGIVLGLVTGVGVSGAVLAVTGLFDRTKAQPLAWLGIAGGYHLVGLLAASVIVTVWR